VALGVNCRGILWEISAGKKIMPAVKGQPMTTINEERFKKVEKLLTKREYEFLSQERVPHFFVLFILIHGVLFEGLVKKYGYGDIKNENGITSIQFREWRIFWLPKIAEENNPKITILTFPCEGNYQSSE